LAAASHKPSDVTLWSSAVDRNQAAARARLSNW